MDGLTIGIHQRGGEVFLLKILKMKTIFRIFILKTYLKIL